MTLEVDKKAATLELEQHLLEQATLSLMNVVEKMEAEGADQSDIDGINELIEENRKDLRELRYKRRQLAVSVNRMILFN